VKAVNLIPSEQRSGTVSPAGESNGAAYIVLGVLAGAAVLALLYGVARHQVSSRTAEVTKVTAEAQVTQARASQLAPYVSFQATYQQRLQAVSQLAGTRFDWAHAFHELGRVLPKDAAISSVHGTIGSATGASSSSSSAAAASASTSVTSATPPGAVPSFALSGCATSQSEVAQTLQRLRLIDGVSAVSLQSSTKSTGASSSGGCPPKAPAFAVTVSFSPLPTPPAPSPSVQSAADTSAGASSAPASTSTSPASTAPAAGKGAQ
jgi:Tfp pilus assembly protein PilN